MDGQTRATHTKNAQCAKGRRLICFVSIVCRVCRIVGLCLYMPLNIQSFSEVVSLAPIVVNNAPSHQEAAAMATAIQVNRLVCWQFRRVMAFEYNIFVCAITWLEFLHREMSYWSSIRPFEMRWNWLASFQMCDPTQPHPSGSYSIRKEKIGQT